jgi:hypothetical protein
MIEETYSSSGAFQNSANSSVVQAGHEELLQPVLAFAGYHLVTPTVVAGVDFASASIVPTRRWACRLPVA